MNDYVKKLLFIAQAEVGVREDKKNNTGKRIYEYQLATWLKPGAWPWCAAFACWVLQETIKGTDLKIQRCQDASAFGWEKWAAKYGFALLSEDKLAKAGDFVIFDFSHIGIVVKDQISINDKIETIEGNTNGAGDRDSVSGDGVWRKKRDHRLTRHYIRIFS